MNFITRIPIICSIKDYDNSIINNKGKEIITGNIITVHQRLLSKLNDMAIFPALIFENEIYMTQFISDSIRTELFAFITTNNSWDMIVVSPFFNVSLTPISGNISKLNDSSTFHCSSVYFASARFMNKNKINDISNIQTYVYTNPFLQNMPHYINKPKYSGKYSVGKISNVVVFSLVDIKYRWDTLDV
jgi:hypothetical protein